MVDKKLDFGIASYILGILSIIFGIATPFAGFITGIVGIVLSKRQKNGFSTRGKKLSIIGIVISIIVLVATMIITYYAAQTGALAGLQNFPTG